MYLRRDFPFLFKAPVGVLGVCLGTQSVHLRRLHAAWHQSAQDAWVRRLPLFPQAQRETVGPDSGLCRNTHTPQHIKLSPWFLILMTVAGSPPPALAKGFTQMSGTEVRLELWYQGSYPRRTKSFSTYSHYFFNHFLFMGLF